MTGPLANVVYLLVVGLGGIVSVQAGRVWSIAIGHDWGAHEYFDSEGRLQGFGFDLVDQVCREGRMECRMVYDKYSNCWQSNVATHPSGGRGLMGRWYDGCIGWVPTVERIHTMTFTNYYLKQTFSYFFFLKGRTFDSTDLAGKKIGFLNGWASNEKCVARQTGIRNSVLTADQILFIDYAEALLQALKDNKVQAVFMAEDNWTSDQRLQIDKTGATFSCFLGGNGIIARKDSQLVPMWNVAFAKLKDSNRYSKFCDEWSKKHSAKGDIQCKI